MINMIAFWMLVVAGMVAVLGLAIPHAEEIAEEFIRIFKGDKK